LFLAGAAVNATADNDDHESGRPHATTGAATAVADRSATLTAQIKPRGRAAYFRFEYGRTTSYGQSTPVGEIAAGHATRTVTAAIRGLAPETRYHFRVRAGNRRGARTGGDRSFTTTASAEIPPPSSETPLPGGETPLPDGDDDETAPPDSEGSAPDSAAASRPVLGRSVTVAPLLGTITVKRPGSAGFVQLAAGASVPVGTLVDTRSGIVILGSSTGAGHGPTRRPT